VAIEVYYFFYFVYFSGINRREWACWSKH